MRNEKYYYLKNNDACDLGAIQRYCQLGPTCRHAEDLWPLFNALRHKEPSPSADAAGYPVLPGDPALVDMSSVVVYDVCYSLGHSLLLSSLHPDQERAQRKAINALQKAGATIMTLEMPELTAKLDAFSVWSAMMDRESPLRFDEIIREGLGSMFHPWELIKSFFGLSVHTVPAMLLAVFQRLVGLIPAHQQMLCKLGDEFREKLHAKLESKGDKKLIHHVIVMPTLACPAPMHLENLLRIFDVSNTAFFNTMELPVTAVPMGLSAAGLPTGVQVVAGHGMDFVSIAVALRLEADGVAGWKPPIADPNHCSA